MKKTNNTLFGISLKMETILNHAKSKNKLIRELNERISSMLESLDKSIKNYVEEEANETEYDESLLLIELKRKVEKVKCLVKSRIH